MGNGITSGSSGNVYVIGGIGGGGLDGNPSAGGQDIFVVKYSSSGVKQWTKQLGTSTTDYGNDITSDSSGNVYVTGSIYGGLNGDPNAGEQDIFVVNYDENGNMQ